MSNDKSSTEEKAITFNLSVMRSLPSEDEIHQLLKRLDKYARELNERDYGLPVYSDEKITTNFQNIVIEWLKDRGNRA